MIKIVSSKYFLIGIFTLLFSLILGGDIPNMLFRIWIVAGVLAIATLLSYTFKIKYTFYVDKEEIKSEETIKVRYRFFNHSKAIPANYGEIIESNDINIEKDNHTRILSIPPLDEYLFEKEVNVKRRGIYDLGKCVLKTRDIFGIFEIQRRFDPQKKLIVLPRVFDINEVALIPSESYGSHENKISFSEDYTNIDKIRKYVVGDSHKKINHKLTARFSEIFINEFESSSRASAVFFMDGFKSEYLNDEERKGEDKLIELIASMTKFFLIKKIPLLYMDSTSKKRYLEMKNEYDFKGLLKELAGFNPDGDLHSSRVLEIASKDFLDRKVIFIFSKELDKEKISRFFVLKKKGYKIIPITVGDYENRAKYESMLIKENIWPINIGVNQPVSEVFSNRR